jgi:hypothetical protein
MTCVNGDWIPNSTRVEPTPAVLPLTPAFLGQPAAAIRIAPGVERRPVLA